MTNDQIIEIAAQTGISNLQGMGYPGFFMCSEASLTKFAELIQARAVPDGYEPEKIKAFEAMYELNKRIAEAGQIKNADVEIMRQLVNCIEY